MTNVIWSKMLAKNRKLPGESFTDYLKMKSTNKGYKEKPYI